MTVTGIIAEFNPFHNGHKYLLEQAEGVKIPHLVLAQSKNVTSSGEYGAFETIEISKIPTAGYFTIDNFNDITYISNV